MISGLQPHSLLLRSGLEPQLWLFHKHSCILIALYSGPHRFPCSKPQGSLPSPNLPSYSLLHRPWKLPWGNNFPFPALGHQPILMTNVPAEEKEGAVAPETFFTGVHFKRVLQGGTCVGMKKKSKLFSFFFTTSVKLSGLTFHPSGLLSLLFWCSEPFHSLNTSLSAGTPQTGGTSFCSCSYWEKNLSFLKNA